MEGVGVVIATGHCNVRLVPPSTNDVFGKVEVVIGISII